MACFLRCQQWCTLVPPSEPRLAPLLPPCLHSTPLLLPCIIFYLCHLLAWFAISFGSSRWKSWFGVTQLGTLFFFLSPLSSCSPPYDHNLYWLSNSSIPNLADQQINQYTLSYVLSSLDLDKIYQMNSLLSMGKLQCYVMRTLMDHVSLPSPSSSCYVHYIYYSFSCAKECGFWPSAVLKNMRWVLSNVDDIQSLTILWYIVAKTIVILKISHHSHCICHQHPRLSQQYHPQGMLMLLILWYSQTKTPIQWMEKVSPLEAATQVRMLMMDEAPTHVAGPREA